VACSCWLWWAIGGALALWATGWAHLRFWRQRLTRPAPYDETHRIKTPDGSAFELRRLRPVPGRDNGPPVLLCHGIAINHRNVDPDDQLSLARSLHEAGKDVWLLTLRSGRSDLTWAERRGTRFSAMVAHDVPLAVQEVRRRTDTAQIDYVGFSMGGMLWYGALDYTVPQLQVRRTVIIGSPGRVGQLVPFAGVFKALPPTWMPDAPLRLGGQLVAFAAEWFETWIHRLTMNLRNCTPGYVRHVSMEGVQDVPGPLLHDLVRWAHTDRVPRLDDGRDILAGLGHVDVPVLMVAGTADKLCPVGHLQFAFERWGCNKPHTPKRMLVVGKAHGHADDYGHTDLMIGRNAARDVLDPIVQFLR